MDLTPYVDNLRRALATAAAAGGDDARELADRLTAPLESAVVVTLLEALSAAADEITAELAPGSVEVRLRGHDPDFVVTPAMPLEAADGDEFDAGGRGAAAYDGDGNTARFNLRLPESLKGRIEDAAAQEGLSLNAWLVRAAASALNAGTSERLRPRASPSGGDHFTGWVR